MDKAMANKRYLLYHGGILRRDWFSDKLKKIRKKLFKKILLEIINLLSAFNISIVTSTESAIVIGCGSSNAEQLTPSQSLPPARHLKWFF